MKVFIKLISMLLTVILLFGGCARPTNTPTTEPANTEETQTPTEESTQTVPVETEEDDDSVAIESLLGVEDLRMQTVDMQYHPYDMNAKLYTYRFYSKASGDLLVIENVLRYELDDFDGDGVVELFAQVYDEKQYILCDLVDGKIVMESHDLVPDMVLDYEMLLDSEEYYLHEEKWASFFEDPAGYVAEVAKRPEERLFFICPGGIIPAYTDKELIDAAVTELHTLLDGAPAAYEKKIIYKLLNEIQLSYMPQLTPGADFNYGRLLEQWCATSEWSTEYYNCLQQISDVFDGDPVAFLKGVAAVDQSTLSKDIGPVVSYLAQTNYLYNQNAFRTIVNRLNANAESEAEKALSALFQTELDAQSEPAIYAEKLLGGESADLWRAFFYNPDKTLNVLASCKEEQLKYLAQKLWGIENWTQKLLDKGYAVVDRVLKGNPEGKRKDVAYQFLLQLEWEGGYGQEYLQGLPFDYQRLFEKWTYSDGALATNCCSQMYKVFDADPEAFMNALVQWNKTAPEGRDMEMIALNFAYQYRGNNGYRQILNELLKSASASEGARIFIQQSEKVENE